MAWIRFHEKLKRLRQGAAFLRTRSKVSVVASNSPIEQNIFHLWALPDVMNKHASSCLRTSPVHNNSDMRDIPSQIPSDEISGRIVIHFVSNWQRLALAQEEHHQIWDSSVINI
jgi:hypothetical protein